MERQEPLPVAAQQVAEEEKLSAAAMPPTVRLGTSSWTFPGWSGLVYAEGTKASRLAQHGLRAYAQHPLLRTVGIDRTFYAPILTEDFARYAAAVPPDFRFLVKAWGELLTPWRTVRGSRSREPNPNYLESSIALERVLAPAIEGLGKKLGPLVFQFSPQGSEVVRQPDQFARRLRTFLQALPIGPLYAIELRDPQLLTASYRDALGESGAHHCYAVHARMPSIEAQRSVVPPTGPVVARWMLHPGSVYDEAVERYEPFDKLVDPDPTSRQMLADLIRDTVVREKPCTVVVNNKAEGCAPLSVFALAKLITNRSA